MAKKSEESIKNIKCINIMENVFFIVVFICMMIISGAHISNYKFLFLFLIISNTIQFGLHQGLSIAFISSVIILVIDLVYYPNEVINNYFEDDLILVGVFILTAWPLGYYVKIEDEYTIHLMKIAHHDTVTGIYNYGFFRDKLIEVVEKAQTAGEVFAVFIIDINNFNYYNNLNGHQKGDEALRLIGNRLKEYVGDKGIAARYGTRGFAIILTNPSETLEQIAEHIKGKIEEIPIVGQENQPTGNLTVTIASEAYSDQFKTDIEFIQSLEEKLRKIKVLNQMKTEEKLSILDELRQDLDKKQKETIDSIRTLISVINAKDHYTQGHSERMLLYGKLLADKLELSKERKEQLLYGAYMHDVGKLNISESILKKRGFLTESEWQIVKEHPIKGVEILRSIGGLEEMIPIVLYHHERYDGTGYPFGIEGEKIPLLARAVALLDYFDTILHQERQGNEEIYEALRKESGSQFDTRLVEKFIETLIENKNSLEQIN